MTAKEMFKKIGYKRKIYSYKSKAKKCSNGMQYIKKGTNGRTPEDELKYCGTTTTKTIEIYFHHKEICIYTEQEYRDGTTRKWDLGILNFNEFKAIQQQIKELGWEVCDEYKKN